METFIIILKNVIIFVLLAVPGCILVKTKLIKREAAGVLSSILMYAGMPFLVVNGVLKVSFTQEMIRLVLYAFAAGIIFHVLLICISKPLTLGFAGEGGAGVERFCMIFANNGFLGIPLVSAVFGEGSGALMCVIVINLVTNITMYTAGETVMAGERRKFRLKKVLLNPLLIAFAAGIILNVTGVASVIPETVTFTGYFANIVTPLSMTVIGIQMAGISFKKMLKQARLYYVSLIKLVITPLFIFAVLNLLRGALGLTEEFIYGAFIAFAVPTAGLAPVYAGMYKKDEESAVCYTMGSTVLSVATIPLLFMLVSAFI